MQLKLIILYITILKFSNAANVCDNKLCNYEGECQLDANNQPSCKCIGRTFFGGPKCNEEIKNCESNPCKNGGTCRNYIGHYNCKCSGDFGGQDCKIRYNDAITGFHFHYNRLAEVGKAQSFLLTIETVREGSDIFVFDLFVEDYVIDGLIYTNYNSKYSTAFKKSDNLIALARSLGLRYADKMPYKKGYYHISKGTFWKVDTAQLTMSIKDLKNNQLYYNDKMMVQVYKPNEVSCIPEVEILNCNRVTPSLRIDVTQYNVLTPVVKNRCGRNSQMIYKWSLKNTLGKFEFHNFGQSKQSILKIKPYVLSFKNSDAYNQKYLIQADVTEEFDGKSFKTIARCYIETDAKPVKSVITGGPTREVNMKQSFILDGSKSRDYYFAPSGKQHLQYNWDCTSTDDADNLLCDNFNKRDAKNSIDASQLKLQKSYTFSLRVESSINDDGIDTTKQTIKVIEGAPLYIEIQCVRNCAKGQYVAGNFVHLKAHCLNCAESESSSNFVWTLKANSPGTTDTNKARLIFTPTETQLTVQLELTQGERKGTSQLQLNINLPPEGGSCTITPTSGKEFETEFELSCLNYKDVDLALSYELKTPQLLLERCNNPKVKLHLPAMSKLQVNICDAYKACTTANVAVQVSAMEVPQDIDGLQQLLRNPNTNLRRFIRDGEVRKLMVLTFIILKGVPTLETASLVMEHLVDLEILTLIEAEQFTTVTTHLMKALKPLDNEKAALLAKFFRKMSIGYRNILQDGEVRELQSVPYKQLTEELKETLNEFSVPLETIDEVHTTTVQQETDDLLAEKYPDFPKFNVTILPRIENWLQAAVELNKCIKLLGHMATNMHEPSELPLLVERGDLSIETFAIEGTTQREFVSKDDFASVKLNSGAIVELQAQLESKHLLIQIVSTPLNPYWWYPDEEPLDTGVFYFNVFSRPKQTTASIYHEFQLQNPFELSMKLQQSKQKPSKLLKGYVETPLDMPIFETFMPIDSMLVVQFQATSVDLKVMLRLGVRPRGYMVKKSTTLITTDAAQNQNLTLINDSKQETFAYLAVLAASEDITKRADFTFTTMLRECLSWSFLATDPAWFTNGCIPIGVANDYLRCQCQHLSTFAGKIKPTITQPALGERQLLEYVPINWVMVLFYFLLLCALGYLLWRAYHELLRNPKDRLIIEIDDNEAEKDFDIVVHFHTGGQWNAGTTANLRLSLGTRTYIIYQNPAAPSLTTSSTCSVHLPIISKELLPHSMKISISHDGAGRYPSWYCNAIDVQNKKTQKSYYFDVRKWISTEPLTVEAIQVNTLTKPTQIKKKFENLFNNWFGCQAFTGPWRSGIEQLNRSERTMIWIIKVSISICIVACYFGRTTLENYEEEREKYYTFNINILELFVLSIVCYFVGIIVQMLLIYAVLKY